MNINRMNQSANAPQANADTKNIDQLRQQRNLLQKQLDAMKAQPQKGNDPKVAEKKQKLQKQIAMIDQKIAQLSKEQPQISASDAQMQADAVKQREQAQQENSMQALNEQPREQAAKHVGKYVDVGV